MATCPNCPPGYDCASGNYSFDDFEEIRDEQKARLAGGPCAPRARGCGYPQCECDRDYPCASHGRSDAHAAHTQPDTGPHVPDPAGVVLLTLALPLEARLVAELLHGIGEGAARAGYRDVAMLTDGTNRIVARRAPRHVPDHDMEAL